MVVVSALARVTDQLLEAGRDAAMAVWALLWLRSATSMCVTNGWPIRWLEIPLTAHSTASCESDFRALESLLLELEAAGKLDLKSQDQLLGFGEVFSSKLVKEALCEAGSQCRACRRAKLHRHRREARAGKSCLGRDQRKLQAALDPLLQADCVPVLGGFIASTLDGVATTLGRGGSDFTAAIVGAALRPRGWKSGLMLMAS